MTAAQSRIATFLWYDGDAEQAARFYTSLFPDSEIGTITRSPIDYPGGTEGAALVVEFTVLGQPFVAMNGGPDHPFTDAVSIAVYTDTQGETDRYWDALTGDGGEEVQCGWLKDRWGLSWQITPRALMTAISNPDRAAAKRAMDAMMPMKKIDIAAIEAAVGEKAEA